MKQILNKNQKTVAEIEIRFGVKVYKFEAKSGFRWVFLLVLLVAKFLLEEASG